MAQAPLIDQSLLEKLERLTLHWQKSFPGLVGGRNASRFSGPGQEFLDHRHFHQGDDYRAVNWRAFLRFEKLLLKLFQVEPRIPVRILLDTSASMGTGDLPKFDYARKLAAALTYVGLVRLDTVCLQTFSSELEGSCNCGGGRHRFLPAVQFLNGLDVRGSSNFLQVARQFSSAYQQRGLVVVISDFLDEQDPERPLQYIADLGHELMLIHIWAPEDREPPWSGELELIDAESGAHLEMEANEETRVAYTRAFDDYARRLQTLALRTGGRYVGLPVNTSVEDAIFGPMMRAGSMQ
ncbi:MAG TPA: DUF58 domain-containing protein [Bryobacteraceae bacterium]|nr:DUF58 domain-containing protein [Bryobacteraceae bacterium]